MNSENYFLSLTQELDSLKNRVRDIISKSHWQTDGEWKESVLRSILRRHLPKTVEVGRGFIITKDGNSNQIDVLLYDTSKPILYKDGDLVFITPDAARGIIEVKSKITSSNLKSVLNKLSKNAEFINKHVATHHPDRFFALFSYDYDITDITYILDTLHKSVKGRDSRLIYYLCFGKNTFIRYWELSPLNQKRLHYKWHAYELINKAPAYFINNIIDHICPESVSYNLRLWFPEHGKEPYKIGEVPLKYNDNISV